MPSLVSVAEVRARVKAAVSMGDTDLQLLIDANEVLMRDRMAGSSDTSATQTVRLRGYPASVILLPERVGSVTSVTEHWLLTDILNDVELDESDWRLAPQGTAIERREDGVNPQEGFADEVIIEYEPLDQTALRKNVLIQLCAADFGFTPGVQSQTLGDYSETKSSSAKGQASIAAIKEDILAQLTPALPVFS